MTFMQYVMDSKLGAESRTTALVRKWTTDGWVGTGVLASKARNLVFSQGIFLTFLLGDLIRVLNSDPGMAFFTLNLVSFALTFYMTHILGIIKFFLAKWTHAHAFRILHSLLTIVHEVTQQIFSEDILFAYDTLHQGEGGGRKCHLATFLPCFPAVLHVLIEIICIYLIQAAPTEFVF
jgi:hypothetical protein